MDKINVGIIGCGRIADLHALGYEENPAARIYAVCDTDPSSAERRKGQWQADRAYSNHLDLLADPEVEAVEILVPHAVHESIMVDAAKAGKHIALQKPMTNDLASADRMLAAAEEAGIVFKVMDNYMFYPPHPVGEADDRERRNRYPHEPANQVRECRQRRLGGSRLFVGMATARGGRRQDAPDF